MDEQATFETRAVVPPRQRRRSRLALLVPVVALVATAGAGLNGPSGERPGPEALAATDGAATGPSIEAGPSAPETSPPTYPDEVLGFAVQSLATIEPARLGPDQIVALAGWYLATAITDCPPQAEQFRETDAPDTDRRADPWRFCERSGVLFASRPTFDAEVTSSPDGDRATSLGPPAVNVSVDEHVIMPPRLEVIGGESTPVVVLARFAKPDDRCHWPLECPQALIVDHIAWTPTP